ncbi:DUF3567 domain-containing protein [Piscinibacter sakaiensis]|uniref:DUF3567 domain-containing protein n=1 Tax=Piscinibacter sakaiensis TaxID=1547922 RepID=A0A0K8NXK6_PISS1|nr:DUF3567 domain-containing protein [Piscinibacter sakaiensis]GAP35034.1 hypothetical protein ISF6_0599 [Piscinibacter sakaiensis]
MQMLYNSDHYTVVEFDLPVPAGAPDAQPGDGLPRGGYEIVDKFARKEIYLEGVMAEQFKEGVQALIAAGPSEDDFDDYIGGYASLMQHPVVMH